MGCNTKAVKGFGVELKRWCHDGGEGGDGGSDDGGGGLPSPFSYPSP